MFSLYGLEAKSVINTGVFINDPFCLKCKIKSDFKIEKKKPNHVGQGYKVHLHGYDWIWFILRLYLHDDQFLIFLFKIEIISKACTNVHEFFKKSFLMLPYGSYRFVFNTAKHVCSLIPKVLNIAQLSQYRILHSKRNTWW